MKEEDQDALISSKDVSIVEKCYQAFNNRDMSKLASCFSANFKYDDGQYLGTITSKQELIQHFQELRNVLPSDSKVIMDDIAICTLTGNIGTKWHIEKGDGSIVNYTKGVSFYTTDSKGLIKTAFKVSEMIVKPSTDMADRLVSSASRFMNDDKQTSSQDESFNTNASIIEKYFEAWNRRDMDTALAYFCDDCIYETEDPVFVASFRGKKELRNHLVKNAKSLPSSAQIILDDLAIDTLYGTFGVKWHLEVNGISIPNLRGCSMYTLDKESQLLKSGYDVTESPVKVPRIARKAINLPSKLLLSLLK
ncbi:hypothetical protein CTEN210_18193 [Chaetoceros tenuissimus]|uniref:SnoaL-like domain-containing protein n=1 Tax=Chaetoceros tenuissimus TaxID=426638 RepID=A0AAD3DD02_9STRA|nr:hypothetical protein CTEN210_18193 [Chaetoceros tenuissimus]